MQGESNRPSVVSSALCIVLTAMAGGMGWGIRGQYGHETGAMIAGLLVGLVLVRFFCLHGPLLWTARAVAMITIGIGVGGTMTYGQTIGLTQDVALRGNWGALLWGMLGLAIKGGIWIGFAGVFLGSSLSGTRYRWWEWVLIVLVLMLLKQVGIWLLNEPFDPSNKRLPWIYFSDDWRWEPDAELKPRREVWGGLALALIGLVLYLGVLRRDLLAMKMGFWGVLGGVLGFPGGQCIQAYHAWNPEVFQQGFWKELAPYINWWNMMETSFGAIMGATLALGLILHRAHIQCNFERQGDGTESPIALEWLLLVMHLGLLIAAEFGSNRLVSSYYGDGLVLLLLPTAAVTAGRWWPFFVLFPVTATPILGKTLRQLVYRDATMDHWTGWAVYAILPMLLLLALATYFALATKKRNQPSVSFAFLFWRRLGSILGSTLRSFVSHCRGKNGLGEHQVRSCSPSRPSA